MSHLCLPPSRALRCCHRALALARAPPSASPACRTRSLHARASAPAARARPVLAHRPSRPPAPTALLLVLPAKRWATSTTPHSTASDPAALEAFQCLEQGTQKLEEGDVHAAKELYRRSVEIQRNAHALFNLGVTHYHLKEFDEAIAAWKESIQLQPSSADAHTNLASAYVVSPVARPDLALQHLRTAADLAPEDPEIAFNLAAVLEACGRLEEALKYYKRSKEFGVERAASHILNVSAKLAGQKLATPAKNTGSESP
ncbi:TPR-like protein [Auriscalpium vulgare]|uniref:TPR-like protein n=1 Tax=Auriscalpium vulgare TaxID=40419 RepID=A0ACB8RKS2_9AGAM|nr:TPR-like protein [Auriscalpium vulgare]